MAERFRFSCGKHGVYFLIGFYVIGAVVVILYFSSRQKDIIEASSLKDAERCAIAIQEFRTLYTSEVVNRAMAHGMEVTHDYKDKEGALPLPATLSMMLGERIGAREGDHTIRLYSKYPFPWREKTGGLRDNFQREAWDFFSKNPEEPFYQFQKVNGNPVLRFAIADRMRANCVSCHNTHPESPKTDWREGDVRGIVEVTTGLNPIILESRKGMVGTILVMLLLGILGIIGLFLVIRGLRQINQDLNKEMTERKHLEKAILQVREEEQKRIGRDLHDDLGQQLTGIAFLMKLLANKLNKKSLPKPEEVQALSLNVKNAIDTTRRISHGLYAMEVEALGLIGALDNLVSQTHETSGVVCSFSDQSHNFAPKNDYCEHLYRIVQEALNNAVKHGKPRNIHVDLITDNSETTVLIRDDGNGFSEDPGPKMGMGLQIMKLRARVIGADLEIQSKPQSGTTIRVKLGHSKENRDDPGI